MLKGMYVGAVEIILKCKLMLHLRLFTIFKNVKNNSSQYEVHGKDMMELDTKNLPKRIERRNGSKEIRPNNKVQ